MESESTNELTRVLLEAIQAVIARESGTPAERCRESAREVSEPALRAVLLRISEAHRQHMRDPQASLGDQSAREAVTRQINEIVT